MNVYHYAVKNTTSFCYFPVEFHSFLYKYNEKRVKGLEDAYKVGRWGMYICASNRKSSLFIVCHAAVEIGIVVEIIFLEKLTE